MKSKKLIGKNANLPLQLRLWLCYYDRFYESFWDKILMSSLISVDRNSNPRQVSHIGKNVFIECFG